MARLHRDMMSVLTAEIVAGVRAPGEMLPREADLAEQFDVSRGVARECIRAMEERGLISVKHGKGATVNESDMWNMLDSDVLAAMLETPSGSEILSEYLECRRILEVEAAGLAAERANARQLERLHKALMDMEATVVGPSTRASEDRFHEADIAFHQTLIGATGNRALGGLVETIHAALLAARYPLARPQYRADRAIPEHRRIYLAISAHDREQAQEAMATHLQTVASYLKDYSKQTEQPGRARRNGRRRASKSLPAA
jgi:GntR family transcriptional repressor for pyruvate dehydrogenase complex